MNSLAVNQVTDETSKPIQPIPYAPPFKPQTENSIPSIYPRAVDGMEKKASLIELLSPSQITEWEPPEGFMIAGDCHLVRGSMTVLGGAGGVGKSRASLALAIAGATQQAWMGIPIHAPFKTLIVQAENGKYRLKTELTEILKSLSQSHPSLNLDDWLKITPPPRYGLAFAEPDFQAEMKQIIESWKPDLIIIDPWNRVAEGDKQADYKTALESVLSILPENDTDKPAILIIHHLRKKSNEAKKKIGTDLMHELAGSYQIASSARCIFALERVSNQTEDDRVVLTCCKNNDGGEGEPSAWHRRNGLFEACQDFDWDEYYANPESSQSRGVSFKAIQSALQGMSNARKGDIVSRLVEKKVCLKSKAYGIIQNKEFPDNLIEDNKGYFYWKD